MHRIISSQSFVILMAISMIFAACTDDESPTQGKNHKPVIQSLTASPPFIRTGGETVLSCVATDQDQDSLTYSWSWTEGSVYGYTTRPSVTWRAPNISGDYSVMVTVSDGIQIAQDSVCITVQLPPSAPHNPIPANNATEVPLTTFLTWSCIDPDGDPVTFDVYFGTDGNPSLVEIGVDTALYDPENLISEELYYWKIEAKDNQGNSTTGSVWRFTTESGNQPPSTPSDPEPANGAQGVPTRPTLYWTCTDPDGDELTYDVYFGSYPNPPLVTSNRNTNTYSVNAYDRNTIYYWKIVAKDGHGNETVGEVWRFTTEQ